MAALFLLLDRIHWKFDFSKLALIDELNRKFSIDKFSPKFLVLLARLGSSYLVRLHRTPLIVLGQRDRRVLELQ